LRARRDARLSQSIPERLVMPALYNLLCTKVLPGAGQDLAAYPLALG
jgi:hypothetical protein